MVGSNHGRSFMPYYLFSEHYNIRQHWRKKIMSRTVTIREISKIRKSEIPKFETLTRKEIVQDYEKVLSLFEGEYLSDEYSSMRKLLTKINTSDGHILYIANTKILVMCSDSLLANTIEANIRNYVACTYRDITNLAGQKILAKETKFEKDNSEPDGIKTMKREIKFKIPEKKRGVHVFFFDDMD